MLSAIFQPFEKKSPVSVMARAMTERAVSAEQIDQWFEPTAKTQYTGDLLFSSVFSIMSQVVSGKRPSVDAAYQGREEHGTYQKILKNNTLFYPILQQPRNVLRYVRTVAR